MTVPNEFEFASDEFSHFLRDARDVAALTSTHQAFTMTQGVLQAFRRRLSVADALAFAQVLPVGLRALFVKDWNVREPLQPFADRQAMTAEVQALRGDHNLSPDTAIENVAAALRRHVDVARLDAVLEQLPPEATDFWRVPGAAGSMRTSRAGLSRPAARTCTATMLASISVGICTPTCVGEA